MIMELKEDQMKEIKKFNNNLDKIVNVYLPEILEVIRDFNVVAGKFVGMKVNYG